MANTKSSKSAAKPTGKTSNGSQIKTVIKAGQSVAAKDHPLQFEGSFMKEDASNKELLIRLIPYFDVLRPASWFKDLTGQVIFALSKDNFVGLIEVVNSEHAGNLESEQFMHYCFATVVEVGEKLAELKAKEKGNVPVKDPIPFSYIKDTRKRASVIHATEQIKSYWQAAFGHLTNESILDRVFEFLGHGRYVDNLCYYKSHAIKLLKVLALPEVQEAINKVESSYGRSDLLDVVVRLHVFVEDLDQPMFRSLLLLTDIEYFPETYSFEQLKKIEEEFQVLEQVQRTGKLHGYV